MSTSVENEMDAGVVYNIHMYIYIDIYIYKETRDREREREKERERERERGGERDLQPCIPGSGKQGASSSIVRKAGNS